MAELETWVAIGVGFATAVGIIFSIVHSSVMSARLKKSQMVESLQNLEGELTKIKEREVDLSTPMNKLEESQRKTVQRYASDYLNVLEKIAFLREVNYVDEKTIQFFKLEFSYGLKLIQWKMHNQLISNSQKTYPNLTQIIKTLEISESDDPSQLPHWLTLYSKI